MSIICNSFQLPCPSNFWLAEAPYSYLQHHWGPFLSSKIWNAKKKGGGGGEMLCFIIDGTNRCIAEAQPNHFDRRTTNWNASTLPGFGHNKIWMGRGRQSWGISPPPSPLFFSSFLRNDLPGPLTSHFPSQNTSSPSLYLQPQISWTFPHANLLPWSFDLGRYPPKSVMSRTECFMHKTSLWRFNLASLL